MSGTPNDKPKTPTIGDTLKGITNAIRNTSDRQRFGLVVLLPILGSIAWKGIPFLFEDTKSETIGQPVIECNLTLSADPVVHAQITAEMLPQQRLTNLIGVIPEYESCVGQRLNGAISEAIIHESHRLKITAQEEMDLEGEPVEHDHFGLSMRECMNSYGNSAINCIQFRYAGDGIALMLEGDRSNDVYLLMQGYIRYNAALIAAGKPPVILESEDVPAQSLLALRDSWVVMMPNVPAASPGAFVVNEELQVSPIRNIQRNYGLVEVSNDGTGTGK